jgi:hypothetical protein
MKKRFKQGARWQILLVLALTILFSATAAAAIKVTIRNNRNHTISVAFRWSGFDTYDDRRAGWYVVKAGGTKTVNFASAAYALTAQDFGYYAYGGGKVWSGKNTDSRPLPVIIHPKNKFGGHPNGSINGGKRVYFRRMNLKETPGSGRENATATLTFNP